jgi:hypothetical protein
MPILSEKPIRVLINGEESQIQDLINMLNAGNYPRTFMLIYLNNQNFIMFTESLVNGPNRYIIETGNLGIIGGRRVLLHRDRDHIRGIIMQYFGVDQIAGRRARATRRSRRSRRLVTRSSKKNSCRKSTRRK